MTKAEERHMEIFEYILGVYYKTGKFPTYRYLAKVFKISYRDIAEMIEVIEPKQEIKLSKDQFSSSPYEV